MIITMKDALRVLLESGVSVEISIKNGICTTSVAGQSVVSANMSRIAGWLKETARYADDGFDLGGYNQKR